MFAKRKSTSNPWTLYGIEGLDSEIDNVINEIKRNMKTDKPYYAHFYNDDELIVIFKEKVIKVKPHASTWQGVVYYGT